MWVARFADCDFTTRSNDVAALLPRVLPFPHVGFGQDGEWVSANFSNATVILAMGYTNWVDEVVGETTNGLYKFVVSFQDAPPEVVNVTIGDVSVAVADAGNYPFVLGKGVRYNIHFSYLPDGVTYSWDDGAIDPPQMRVLHAPQMRAHGSVNNPRYTVRLISHGDDGRGLEFVSPREDGDGFVVWWPWLSLSPGEEVNPSFPVVLNAGVFDIPEHFVASVTWSANDEILATGETFVWQGDENNITSICVTAQFADIELVGEFQVERHVRESDIAILCGGLIVVEDAYTNAPGAVVPASSSIADLRLSWWLAEEGTLALTADCGSFIRATTNDGSVVSLPLQWHGSGDEENELSISVAGLDTPTNGTFSFTFTPDEGGLPVVRTVPIQVVKVRAEALADWPSNKVRHVFGPKEQFSIVMSSPLNADLGNDSYASINGSQVTAPDRPGEFNVTLSRDGISHVLKFNVVAPASLEGGNPRDLNSYERTVFQIPQFVPGEAGVVMHIDIWLEPSYVSFRHVRMFEGFAPTSNRTGWYEDLTTFPEAYLEHNAQAGAGSASLAGCMMVSDSQNLVDGGDCAGSWIGTCQAYYDGSFDLAIPLSWYAEGGGYTNSLPVNLQTISVYSNGTMRVSKNGVTWERTLDGTTHQISD